jgi:hypothetical protein
MDRIGQLANLSAMGSSNNCFRGQAILIGRAFACGTPSDTRVQNDRRYGGFLRRSPLAGPGRRPSPFETKSSRSAGHCRRGRLESITSGRGCGSIGSTLCQAFCRRRCTSCRTGMRWLQLFRKQSAFDLRYPFPNSTGPAPGEGTVGKSLEVCAGHRSLLNKKRPQVSPAALPVLN